MKEQAELQEKIAELKHIVKTYVQQNKEMMKEEGSESTQPVKLKVCFSVYYAY